jgi:hypothetical protein
MLIALIVIAGILVFGAVLWICVRRISPPPTKASTLLKRFGPDKPPKDERFLKRFQPDVAQSRADLSWMVEGERRCLTGEVVDLSDDGARIKSKLPLTPTMPVLIELPNMRLAGTAKVCYCQKKGWSYHVGLTFKGPLFRTP